VFVFTELEFVEVDSVEGVGLEFVLDIGVSA
jgi:hypothetical protein